MSIKNYKELIVWQRAMEAVEEIYKITRQLPKEEIYGLTSQMRRAAISVPSNIAEGYNRNTQKDFIHFLFIAKGSVAELQTQLLLCERLEYLSYEQIEKSNNLLDEISKMLYSMILKLKDKL